MSNHSESNWSANSCALSAQLSKSCQAPPCKKSAPTGSLGRLTGDAACSEVGATLQGPVLLDCRLHLQTSKEVLHSASIWFHANFKSEYIDVLQSTKNCKGESGQREKMDKILSQTCGWAHSNCIDMFLMVATSNKKTACSFWSSCTMQMHFSMVPTGPPQQGKKGFNDPGAFSASSSSIFFLAVSAVALPTWPFSPVILNQGSTTRTFSSTKAA